MVRGGGLGGRETDPRKNPLLYMSGGSSVTRMKTASFFFPGCISFYSVRMVSHPL